MKRDDVVFGYDFGTLSCRLVAVRLHDGKLLGSLAEEYAHGVISGTLPGTTTSLAPEWFLQSPADWIEVLCSLSRRMLRETGIHPEDVKAIGSDFTSCTLVPVAKNGRVLCEDPAWANRPHAWPKLWKHHAAQYCAEEMEAWAKQNTTWLKGYFGSSVSSEWAFPKIMQVVKEDHDCYLQTDLYMEAVDWLPYALSGHVTRCTATLGVNAFWVKGQGYPGKDFFAAMDPRMENVVADKMRGDEVIVGQAVGTLLPGMAEKMGLTQSTVVCAGHSDGAVAGCGAGATASGDMLVVMGTSTCHQMIYKDYHAFDGVCAIAGDGMVPGMYGYESGQSATGDVFQWYADTGMPAEYVQEAKAQGISRLQYMDERASRLSPGASGLIALDWLNGNRSILSNYNLSGLVVGLTLDTRPEEIYRALVEANLFASRAIIENYNRNGVQIERLYAVGGLARKSAFVMQLFADILGSEVLVPQVDNVPALGAAVCAAAALGPKEGYATVQEAAEALVPKERAVYTPAPAHHAMYDRLYRQYIQLHDYFGRDNSFMKDLKRIRDEAKFGS